MGMLTVLPTPQTARLTVGPGLKLEILATTCKTSKWMQQLRLGIVRVSRADAGQGWLEGNRPNSIGLAGTSQTGSRWKGRSISRSQRGKEWESTSGSSSGNRRSSSSSRPSRLLMVLQIHPAGAGHFLMGKPTKTCPCSSLPIPPSFRKATWAMMCTVGVHSLRMLASTGQLQPC